VRDYTHIEDDCVIGFSTEIKNSYLSDGCQTHMNYIGDSVIGKGCSFGAGTVTANWRLDEKNVHVRIGPSMVDTGRDKLGVITGNNCRTGVNVSLMPGIKIGAGSIIPPGEVVIRDVVPGTGVRAWLRTRGGKR
jgi:bifunctional UDP-N-acetylglucosamine pyrophosphorylase/glucosamine-1-phosphate N-acetyltransferase